jgi:hypothetical protein
MELSLDRQESGCSLNGPSSPTFLAKLLGEDLSKGTDIAVGEMDIWQYEEISVQVVHVVLGRKTAQERGSESCRSKLGGQGRPRYGEIQVKT